MEWRRDGVAIPGAAGQSYRPVAADDRAELTARVTAGNAAGSAAAETAALDIVLGRPRRVGMLADLALVQGANPARAGGGRRFAGEALVYSVAGGGASIDRGRAREHPTGTPVTAKVRVTATNSGGSAAAVSFRVTVAVAAPTAVGTLADVRYVQGSCVKTVATRAAFGGAGLSYALAAAPAGVTIDAATGVVSIPTNALIAATVTVRAQNASGFASQSFGVTVRATVSGGFPEVPAEQLAEATGKALTRFDKSVQGGNNPFFGGAMVTEAYAAFAGQTAADSHVLAQLRYNLQGANCPAGQGGYGLQHQLCFVAAAALAKRTTRIWNDFTSAEKTKIDLLVKAMLIGGAAHGSDHNPTAPGERSFIDRLSTEPAATSISAWRNPPSCCAPGRSSAGAQRSRRSWTIWTTRPSPRRFRTMASPTPRPFTAICKEAGRLPVWRAPLRTGHGVASRWTRLRRWPFR